MYLKLAIGNVRRSVRDYSIYFATLALAACLLYSFTASGDYLLALDLTSEQRHTYASIGSVLEAFSIFVVIVFVFLVAYANRFIVRLRKREFGLYALLGMGQPSVACVLALENGTVGVLALGAGVALGVALSPAFGAIAAFVFGVSWRLAITGSSHAALWTAGCFAAVAGLGALACVRDVLRCPLVELMRAERTPERLAFSSHKFQWVQLLCALPLLAVVWGGCLLFPLYFIAFIIPMGFAAFGATYLMMRWFVWHMGVRARRRPERYWDGLRAFTTRQIEARISSTAAALACVCVLVAAAVCMMCAGFVFSVGMRGSKTLADAATTLAPIGYVGIFYGAAFLVVAVAILALQQLSGASDARGAYSILHELGCDRAMMQASARYQISVCFAVPLVGALVHDVFGLALVYFLAAVFESASFGLIVAGTLGFTVVLMVVYGVLTCRVCERLLMSPAPVASRA